MSPTIIVRFAATSYQLPATSFQLPAFSFSSHCRDYYCAIERRTMGITSINPATGKTIKTYDEMTPETAAAAVAQAHETWLTWRTTSFATRARHMKKAAGILRERKHEL